MKNRKDVNSLELLIEVSVGRQGSKEHSLRSIPKYRAVMELARQKQDLSDKDIAKFQDPIDEWFQDWVQLLGSSGMTNCIHMLATGHISEHLFKYCNLYRHSQQGWESFNSLLKTFFFAIQGKVVGVDCNLS